MADEIIKILTDRSIRERYKDTHVFQRVFEKSCVLKLPQIQGLLQAAGKIFKSEKTLLELNPPITLCGDVHAQFYDMLWLFECCKYPPDTNYCFLGDFVDRGKYSIEVMSLLYAYKVKYPKNFYVTRGNHEAAGICSTYGFLDECKQRFNQNLWKQSVAVFNLLPLAVLIGNKVYGAHGGISPELTNFNDIRKIRRPTDVPMKGLVCDILWTDPNKAIKGWGESERGVSYSFGADVAQNFVKNLKLVLICRAHQVVPKGYEFFAKKTLLTIFSAPNYCGEFANDSACLMIDGSFKMTIMCMKLQMRDSPDIAKKCVRVDYQKAT